MHRFKFVFMSPVFNFRELNETTVLMNLKKRYDQELVYVRLIKSPILPNAMATVSTLLTHWLPNASLLFFFSSTQTYIGSILVSLNPYKLLNIYGTDMVLQYEGHGLCDNPP